MSYDEEQQRRSRVVVETPTARREVVRTETTHVPERQGFSTGAVAALVVGAVVLVTILFLFLMRNQQDEANINARVTTQPTTATQPQQQPVIVQQPAPVQQPPIVVQQPATTQPAPVIVTAPTSDSGSTSSGNNDSAVQSSVDKKISDDRQLASLGITVIVIDGKATLTGMVNSEALKSRAERVVMSVKGVRDVENKIIVEPSTPPE